MDHVLNVYKRAGETPLECIERFRAARRDLADQPLSYAGRLDPMAEGVLLVLVGQTANQNRDTYLMYTKQYSFDAIFGFKTDTYDILGLVDASQTDYLSNITESKIHEEIFKLKGKTLQSYPPFSSRTVKGKPLFQWAREGRLDEISIPQNEIELYTIELLGTRSMTTAELSQYITESIAQVKGDFRQQKILDQWNTCLIAKKNMNFPVYSFRISCSSGTYVRSIVHSLGEKMGTGAVALKIVRERVGDHDIADSLGK